MVNSKDLMLGNWVTRNVPYSNKNGLCSVKTIAGEYIGLNPSCAFDTLPCDIDPIPVTADMLKRIGFEEKKGIYPETFYYRYWDKEYRYKLDIDPDYCNSDRKWSIHIDNGDCNTIGSGEFTYVHELQNLVRVITGFDLPITKEMLYE